LEFSLAPAQRTSARVSNDGKRFQFLAGWLLFNCESTRLFDPPWSNLRAREGSRSIKHGAAQTQLHSRRWVDAGARVIFNSLLLVLHEQCRNASFRSGWKSTSSDWIFVRL